MCLPLHAYGLEHLRHLLRHLLFVLPSCGPEHEQEILLDASVHQKLEVLEHDAHLSPQIRNLLFPDAAKLESAGFSAAFEQRIFSDDRPDYRCLSRADLSHDIYEISRVYIHVQTVYYSRFAVEDVCSLEGDYWCPVFHVQKISITTQI